MDDTGRGRFSPRSMEKLMSDISRLLEEQEFATMEEANAFLQELMESGQPIPSREPETPLEQAQELVYEAWDTGNRRKRVKLAKEALAISEDCADAYVILAEDSARSPEKAMEYYEAGVRAGERALGPEAFDELEGHFWGITETRPYMRARQGLAFLLWEMGQRSEAIDHYRDMLRLNPSDNQGIRYVLLACLLEEDSDTEAEQLLHSYDEPTATWLYSNALLAYRKYGPTRKTTKQLIDALKHNPHVPGYLLGQRSMQGDLPGYVGFGDESEAMYYAAECAHLWYRQAGALDWLRETDAELPNEHRGHMD
jgi:tetratricopeptide (TPR) repeat protein